MSIDEETAAKLREMGERFVARCEAGINGPPPAADAPFLGLNHVLSGANESPMCPDCVAFWAKHTRVNADGETEVNTIGRICPCSPPKGPVLAVVGTTSNAPAWTEEQFAEWLTSTGACRSDVAAEVAKRQFNPPPVTVVRIEAKEPA